MLSGIIKESRTFCCFVGLRKLVGTSLCNVARGWVGYYIFTIERLREWAGKSRTMPVRLLPECAHRGADASLTMMIADERAGWPRLISPARLANRAIKDQDNDQLKFTTDETDASVRYFGHTGCPENALLPMPWQPGSSK
jgi:hypothetical protein